MQIIDNLENYQENEKTSLAIGVFDGVHMGHVAVIKKAIEKAKAHEALPAILTFKSTPKIKDQKYPINLTSFEHKMHLIERLGCKRAFVVKGDDRWLFEKTAKQFVHEILKEKLNCRAVSVGENFRFGKKRQGDAKNMANIFLQNRIDVNIVPMVRIGDDVISTSLIKNFIERDMSNGRQVGVRGTPTIFINGKKLRNRSLPGFYQMIETELKKAD